MVSFVPRARRGRKCLVLMEFSDAPSPLLASPGSRLPSASPCAAGTGSAAICRTIAPKSRRVR